MGTQVRQRITRQLHGRRGTATDKVWASRQLLLTGYEHLTVKQKARFNAALAAEDPTNEIAAAHAVKERLRLLLAEHQPHQIRRRLYDFYDAAARADIEPPWVSFRSFIERMETCPRSIRSRSGTVRSGWCWTGSRPMRTV
ncbi:Mobile element protein [Kocuria palustris PEL]|uniref:Mobile element protein n=3 Tax=Kocuria TaxID=57493 RepID=M2WEJ5_9MICC|nr:Mobile element protein [Kocuria palustris PEL]